MTEAAPIIRHMRPDDVPELVAVFCEMQAHYRVPCPPQATIAADLAALPPGNAILVAADAAIAGFAAVAVIYPGPGLKRGLFLKEIFVSARVRGQGFGLALMQGVAAYAAEQCLSRIDWTADRDDAALRAFYRKAGGTEHPDKVFFRLGAEGIARLAGPART